MIKLSQPVIVEGKYDKITLENVIDALIIPTNGFSLFKNREQCELIRALAERFGVIVMTDSDNAGNMIRAYVKKIVGNSTIINVYIPQIAGKEKRKSRSGKEGLLGVEGMTPEILIAAFEKSGVVGRTVENNSRKITKLDLYERGLSGGENSAEKRKELLKYLSLPTNLSSNAMLDILNTILTYDEFCEVTDNCLKVWVKS